jgi:hypothetical protein
MRMRFWWTGLVGCHRCGGKGTLLGGSGWQKIGHRAAVLEVAVLVRGRIGWQKLGHPAVVLDVTVLVYGRIVWVQRTPTAPWAPLDPQR